MGMGDNQGIYLIVLGIVVLSAALVLPRILRRRAPPDFRMGSFGETGIDMKSELERLVAEIRDAAREELARLDTKMRLLNQLLEECDRKMKEFEALLGRAAAGTPVPAAPRGEAGGPPPPHAANPLHGRIYALQDAGKDIQEICAATGLEKGEVELVLGLRKMPPLP